MSRLFPPRNVQIHSQRLRNQICRLGTPIEMAKASSHLRDFAVAEVIGYIAMLDGHPRIISRPVVDTARAAFQQVKGATSNPLAHALPADLLLDGDSLVNLYRATEARSALQRAFGMGVMAPSDWENQRAFQREPRQNNIVDSVAERHQSRGGLVEAFKAAGEAAVAKGRWDGSGRRRHDLASLTTFIREIYQNTWVPRARSAYGAARSHFAAQMAIARNSDPSRVKLLQYRCEILDAQTLVFETESNADPEAAKSVWKSAATETWTDSAAPTSLRFEV